MSADSTTLQDLITLSGDATQDRSEVADVGAYNKVVVGVFVAKAGSTGSVELQEAMRNEEAFFATVPNTSVSLTATGPIKVVVSDPMRYLRWKATNVAGDPTFLIDALNRQ